jgi:SAM-dependent methyltransferase
MRPAHDELTRFYAGSDGLRAARLLGAIVAPSIHRSTTSRLLSVGFTAPLLAGIDTASLERLAMVMPAAQGGGKWTPNGRGNCAVSAVETRLPFAESMFDQALVCHALEFANGAKLLRELWRVLSPAAEVILVVPNRAGIWTHFERTPFGQGQPFGRNALATLLRESMFEPMAWSNALVAPPIRGVRWLDRPLTRLLPVLGGIHIVVARKTDGLAPLAVGRVRHAETVQAASLCVRPD